MFFVGHVVGTSTLAKYGDTIGRIYPLKMGLIGSTMVYGFMIFVSHIPIFHYILMFFFGMFSNIRVNIGFIYGQEIINSKHINVIGSLYNMIDGLTMIGASLYFKYLSKNWLYLQALFFAISAIGTGIAFFLPESPRYLISKGHYERARVAFNEIARKNGKP